MDRDAGSFRVHLQSLNDFALRLQEQLDVVQQPTRGVDLLSKAPSLPLGAFAEAYSRSDEYSDVARQMGVVLEKVARSLDFARSVTVLIAQRYETLDSGGAQNIGSLSGALPVLPPVPVPSVTGTAAPPAGSLAPPEILARITVPVPPNGGTVYYYNGSTTVPVSVTVQAQDV